MRAFLLGSFPFCRICGNCTYFLKLVYLCTAFTSFLRDVKRRGRQGATAAFSYTRFLHRRWAFFCAHPQRASKPVQDNLWGLKKINWCKIVANRCESPPKSNIISLLSVKEIRSVAYSELKAYYRHNATCLLFLLYTDFCQSSSVFTRNDNIATCLVISPCKKQIAHRNARVLMYRYFCEQMLSYGFCVIR